MALEKKTNWNKDKRAKVKSLLESKGAKKLMSSDEEGNDGFISHPYSWRVTLGDRLKTAWMRNTLKFVLPGVEDSFKREQGGQ